MHVLRNLINYVGIVSPKEYPTKPLHFKQFTLLKKIVVPDAKPDIESIIKVISSAKIINTRQIETPYNKKYIIEGKVSQRFIYTAATPKQSVHSFESSSYFCEIIEGNFELENITTKVVIEDINIIHHDLRSLFECKVLCAIIEYTGDENKDEEEEEEE
ncbi:conserved hypothetical protein [Thermincola potens JR]|uniref:SipL SPOCS domain-containing protein n=1 Tax=Thermincola potens (strain JR) TaxID=635013 RepID=D5XC35_THEPJ|nr:conserved hypothetical protein [Thermincola potens JR]